MKNMKALMERRAELQQTMDQLVSAADTETRAMTEEETAQFDAAESEIRAIDETSGPERLKTSRLQPIPRSGRRRRNAPLRIISSGRRRSFAPASRT